MTVWIGLTGGIGSGKSLAAAEFVRLGVPHIDADAISRNLTGDNGKALPASKAVWIGKSCVISFSDGLSLKKYSKA